MTYCIPGIFFIFYKYYDFSDYFIVNFFAPISTMDNSRTKKDINKRFFALDTWAYLDNIYLMADLF